MPCLSGPQWHLTTGDGEPPHSIMSNSLDPRRVAVLTPAGALFEASGDGRLQACAPLASAGSGTSGAGGDGGELTSGPAASGGAASGGAASGGAASESSPELLRTAAVGRARTARAPCGVEKGDQSAAFHVAGSFPIGSFPGMQNWTRLRFPQ
jgi:hypothetical protein